MDVSPRGAGSVILSGSFGDIQEPTSYPTPVINCFHIKETVTLTARAAGGYQFQSWDFNYWPLDRNEAADRTKNPLSFQNTFLRDDGVTESYDDVRTIIVYFQALAAPPQAPTNVRATDGTETEKILISWDPASGAASYKIYWANSPQAEKVYLTATSATTYEDTAVVGTDTYYYWVKAVNQYGESSFSAPESGYAYVDPLKPPPPPVYEPEDISPTDAKTMLDSNPDVIVVDVSDPNHYEANHILCAINSTWNGVFSNLDYRKLIGLEEAPVIIYDQDESTSREAAIYLAGRGYASVYHMTGGLREWMANGFETVDSELICDCALPPMALAGQDVLEVAEGQTVYLNATGSTPTEGNTLTAYEWQQYRGETAEIINGDIAEPIIVSPNLKGSDDQLIFLVTVTDSQGAKDTDGVVVNVKWENDPPVADAGSFQSVPEGDTVILNGSASEDFDDGIATCLWKKISGPEVTLLDSTKDIARFVAPDISVDQVELVFELTVTDQGGLSDTDQISVLVTRNNAPPNADAGPDQAISETQPVELDGSGSKDPDGDMLTYAWTQIGAGPSVRLSSPTDPKPTFTAPIVASGAVLLNFRLTVTDPSGAQSTDEVQITVNDAGDPPVADAGLDQKSVYEGWEITLDGSASSDADGNIQTYKWTQIEGPPVSLVRSATVAPRFTAPVIDTGETAQLEFELTVTDDADLYGSDRVKVVVHKSLIPPTADAGLEQKVEKGKPVVLDGSASSDPDDGIKAYKWRQISGEPAVSIIDPAAAQAGFTAPDDIKDETILAFELEVTDYSGKSDTATAEVRVVSGGGGGGGGGCFISAMDF